VLSGKYRFTPAAPGRAADRVELYADKLGDARFGGGGSGDPQEFVQWVGRFVNKRVVLGKVAGLPRRMSWHENTRPGAFTPAEWDADHAPGPVLKHVAQQTGLSVREETRWVRVLVVERTK
jgi:hypothetical protein